MANNERAPVSVCIIVKNEPFLEQCILSFKDYVEEIVIVDTGSTDNTTLEVVRKYANIWEVYTACNDEIGKIKNFSMARQRSFELATKKWILWCDGDDIISGAENLNSIISGYDQNKSVVDAVGILFPYEYAYNELGQSICTHYRERLLSDKTKFKWVNPVHEVIVPIDNAKTALIQREEVIFKHQRQYVAKQMEPGRNLRILQKYYAEVGDSDARQLYYLGLEYTNVGMLDDAIKSLTKYIDLSGWEDERVMACLKLVDIYQAKVDYQEGLKWAFKAVQIKENWGEGYFAIARMYYFIAQAEGIDAQRNWERCAYYAKLGLACSPTKTLLFVNPLDREIEIHRYLNMALNRMGDVKGALESVNIGLQKNPNDEALLLNKRLYEIFLTKQEFITSLNKLKDLNEIDENAHNIFIKIINKEITYSEEKSKLSQSLVNNSSSTSTIIEQKERDFSLFYDTSKVLDIVFFCGDGVEAWTPATVKNTGIGGSELMALELSKRLAALGHKIRVYNSCSEQEGIYDSVQYLQTNKFHNLQCDVLIVSRRADMLGDQYNIQAKLKLLWVHDVYALGGTNELLLKADRILALSQWHKQNLINHHNLHPDHIITTRNGVDLKRFEKNITRNRFKCVCSSSPDRYLPVLLEVWPRIKKQVPEAELHIFYGFHNWCFTAQNDPRQLDLITNLTTKLKEMEPLGVKYHERVNQERLAEEFLSSGVFLYPTFFTETFFIGGAECAAAGVRFVGSNIAAIKETVGSRGILIDGEWTSREYQDKFIENAVKALTYKDDDDRLLLQKYAQEHFCLDVLAIDWEEMFFNLLNELKINPIVPYFPTNSYRK